MRIIAGTKKGIKILPPKNSATRPIIDRVKESVFDVLYKYDLIKDKLVADVFCGTGSFGLEALSRGAKEALFVDADSGAIAVLKKNISKTGFEAQSRIICGNAFRIGAPAEAEKFSLVFLDPPYVLSKETDRHSKLAKLLSIVSEQITDNGLVVVRTEKRVHLLDSYAELEIIDRRTWGTMNVGFLAKNNDT